jgi:hypothetical protein
MIKMKEQQELKEEILLVDQPKKEEIRSLQTVIAREGRGYNITMQFLSAGSNNDIL